MTRYCYLTCLSNTHPPIQLPHNEEVVIGRSKITKIKDQSCSRKQLSLKADCSKCEVAVKQVGINQSGLDGFSMIKDSVYRVGHGTKIEILLNNYAHLIEFTGSPNSSETDKPNTNKRKIKDTSSDSSRKRMSDGDKTDNEDEIAVKETEFNVWTNVDNGELYIFTAKGVKPRPKIAAFDMDGTLITTKSGRIHPVDINDWKQAFLTVTQKLQDLIKKDYRIVIFSNQAPIGNGRIKIEDFKTKIEKISEMLQVPVSAFIATGKGIYRKPAMGMWQELCNKRNSGIKINLKESFYCGDAAGRIANWAPGKKKDHSMADSLFAENIGIPFLTPEEFFLKQPCPAIAITRPGFDPKQLKSEPFDNRLVSQDIEILVFVGYPGSGKSFLAKQIEEVSDNRYMTVCRDVLGTWQKCATEAKKILSVGRSVIVDSTNPDTESRGRWVSLAREQDVECRCVQMNVTMDHARHNNKFRELTKSKHAPVPDMVFYSYKNKFVEPTTKEGFSEVLQANFNPVFDDDKAEALYRMHLLEK